MSIYKMTNQPLSVATKKQIGEPPTAQARSWIRPQILASLYLMYALVAFFFPGHIYENIIKEPYVAEQNLRLLLFAAGCVISTQIGIALASIEKPGRSRPRNLPAAHGHAKRQSIIIVSVLAILLNIASATILFRQNYDNIVSSFVLGQDTGGLLKSELAADGALVAANPLLIIAAWALYSLRLAGDKTRIILALTLAAVFLSIFISTIKLARFELLPLVVGMAIIKIRYQTRSSRSVGRKLWPVFWYGGICTAAFILFANVRGQASGGDTVGETFAGYTITSFNRLAALLDGRLSSTYGGTGTFVLNFLSNLPVIGSALGTYLPDPAMVFLQEFRDVGASGLDAGYIWLTMYGYYYADIGFWVFAYCFAFGIVAQLAWRSLLKSEVIGTVLYPYIASAMVFSFASYWISRPFITSIAIFLVLYTVCLAISGLSNRSSSNGEIKRRVGQPRQ